MPKRPMSTGGGGPGGYWNHGENGKALILGRLHQMTSPSPNGQPSKVCVDETLRRIPGHLQLCMKTISTTSSSPVCSFYLCEYVSAF